MNFFKFERKITPNKVADTDIDVHITTESFRDGEVEKMVKEFDWKTFQEIVDDYGEKSDRLQVYDPEKKIVLLSPKKFKMSADAGAAIRRSKKRNRIELSLGTPGSFNNLPEGERESVTRVVKAINLIHELLHIGSSADPEHRDPLHETVMDEGINEMTARVLATEYFRRKGDTQAGKILSERLSNNVKNLSESYSSFIYLVYEMLALLSMDTGVPVTEIKKSLLREHLQGDSQGKLLSALHKISNSIEGSGQEKTMEPDEAVYMIDMLSRNFRGLDNKQLKASIERLIDYLTYSYTRTKLGLGDTMSQSPEEFRKEKGKYREQQQEVMHEARERVAALIEEDRTAHQRAPF